MFLYFTVGVQTQVGRIANLPVAKDLNCKSKHTDSSAGLTNVASKVVMN